MLSADERSIVLNALRYWDGRKWRVFVAVVMPDHVHLLAQPLAHSQGGSIDLGEIIHSVRISAPTKLIEGGGEEGQSGSKRGMIALSEMKWSFWKNGNIFEKQPAETGYRI